MRAFTGQSHKYNWLLWRAPQRAKVLKSDKHGASSALKAYSHLNFLATFVPISQSGINEIQL